MLKTLPFNALRTLEAVVRLRGFGRAATELNITQSAVSQHVKQLEEWLGLALLIRRNRQTIPTQHGEQLAQAARDGFGMVEALCDELRGSSKAKTKGILVGAPPGFAFVWLLPRLLSFEDKSQDIMISLSTDPQARDPFLGEADVFIAYTSGGFPGLHAERLMGETMAPVCSPELAHSLNEISDLAHHTVLRDNLEGLEVQSTWEFWAREVGVTLPNFKRSRQYGQANLVVQAAIQGLGVAMGRGPLVADALADGTLVHPFPNFATSQQSYWVVCTQAALKSDSVVAFRDWLHEEVAIFQRPVS